MLALQLPAPFACVFPELPWHALQLLDDFITSMHMAVAMLAKHAAYNAALEGH